MVQNCDLRNTYKCIVKGFGKFGTMEEYLNWCDCYAPLIMQGIVIAGSIEFTTIVGNLHRAIAWFCRPLRPEHTGSNYDSTLEQHHSWLLDYGKFIETAGLPESLLKFTLHVMSCRVKEQCKYRGHIALDNEMFIERAIQRVKNILRGRAT